MSKTDKVDGYMTVEVVQFKGHRQANRVKSLSECTFNEQNMGS